MVKKVKKGSTAESSAAEPVALEATDAQVEMTGVNVVVLGSADMLPLLSDVWKQKAPYATIIPVQVNDDMSFADIIGLVLSDDRISDRFILVPSGCFPTHKLGFADLIAYRVRKMLSGDKMVITHQTGLPVCIDVSCLLKVVASLDESYSEEDFLAAYNAEAHSSELPDEVGMSFGNTVSYAIRPPKCFALLSEAMVKKRFICVNSEAFAAIKNRLALLINE